MVIGGPAAVVDRSPVITVRGSVLTLQPCLLESRPHLQATPIWFYSSQIVIDDQVVCIVFLTQQTDVTTAAAALS